MPECKARWLRAAAPAARLTAVDREARVLRGYVVAQAGPFKDRRGEFDAEGLRQIADMGNASAKGLKSHFTHATLSGDGLGKLLGRARNFRVDRATDARTGARVDAVRADLHFAASASRTPSGDLAGYVMDLAEEDPDGLSSSLVIEPAEKAQVDAKGRQLTDAEGNALPSLWYPKRLHASDIVDTGDAVDGLLSHGIDAGELPDAVVRMASAALDQAFPDAARDVLEARCLAWLTRYLEARYGPPPPPAATPRLDALRQRLARLADGCRATVA